KIGLTQTVMVFVSTVSPEYIYKQPAHPEKILSFCISYFAPRTSHFLSHSLRSFDHSKGLLLPGKGKARKFAVRHEKILLHRMCVSAAFTFRYGSKRYCFSGAIPAA